MECRVTTRFLKINYKKNIKNVVIVVEGARDEFKLLKHIFSNVLHYHYVEKRRTKQEPKEYNEFVMKGNEESRIIVFNTKNSDIGSIENDEDFRNEIYKLLYNKYGVDIKNIPLYYVWDRDKDSNTKRKVRLLLEKLSNPYENDNYENGLLLLSYPCYEAYLISQFNPNINFINKEPKRYIKDNKINIQEIDADTIKKAVVDMHKKLIEMGINEYNMDNFKDTNIKVFETEETICNTHHQYRLLSFISIILLDLGIITIKE